jgi:predicted secreted hydrolase
VGVYRTSTTKREDGWRPLQYGMRPPHEWTRLGAVHLLVVLCVGVGVAGSPAGWKEASPARPITLPADHASHPDYKLEWWYYTGNVEAGRGQRFGYQLTFFRIGVDSAPANPSRWAVRDLYMTHLALTDVTGRRYQFTERMNRRGPGWAGAATDRYRVWNENWQASIDGRVHHLQAQTPAFAIDLQLTEDRPAVLHGDRGYSRKGAAAGNASHYYSLTRMPTRGTITVGGRAFDITGLSWMDHEFGTSFLEPEQIGWDWFSIQLEDGRDLMIFQLRRADGTIDPRSSGTLVEPGGATTPITLESGFRLQPGRTWTSPVSGSAYPVQWTVALPHAGINLSVSAAMDDQELHTEHSTGVTYWEGAVDVAGQVNGRPAKGRGYLEMTGYSGMPMGRFMR